MSEPRLPGLLKQMRAAIAKGDLTACLQLQGQIEEQWDAIQERLHTLDVKCDSIGIALRDLMRGVW